MICAPIEDSDQTAHPHSLIIVLDGHPVYSQGSNDFIYFFIFFKGGGVQVEN